MKLHLKLFTGFILLILSGFLIPEPKIIPVEGSSSSDWNNDSFWYEPWGLSGVHKGIDIFADKGTPLLTTTHMLILYRGEISRGGNIILGLGPSWRLHYYAHLDSINRKAGLFLSKGSLIGTVGDTGNAKGKQPHLHYSIVSLLPQPWKIDSSTQGYKKAFFINPIKYLTGSNTTQDNNY